MKQQFICGFFNAEAAINKTISVQQSVRIELPKEERNQIIKQSKAYQMKDRMCYFIKWSKARDIIRFSQRKESNILKGIKELLESLEINSKIYPIRVYLGVNCGMHYELVIPPRYLKQAKDLKLISCKKKVYKLDSLCRGS